MSEESKPKSFRDEVSQLQKRIGAAIKRVNNGDAAMRIPAHKEDPDLVLADCALLLAELRIELDQQVSRVATQAESLSTCHARMKLQKEAIDSLIATAEFALSTPGFVRGRDALKNAIESARSSITPKGEQSS